jgi:membrane fusion protein (multidrug efflux system)
MPMQRTLAPSLVVLALLLAGCPEEEAAVAAPPPPAVKVAVVLQRDVPLHVEAIGETRGNTEIEIRARVEGFVESVDFKEGSIVEKGQLLYTIDPRPFEAAVAQSKAAVAEAEAQLARTRQDVARYEPLVAKNAISREEYETAVALEKAAAATVDATKAMSEGAEIDLSFTKVLAPEAGLVGKTEVYVGTLVGRGDSTLLTRISRIDPIHVRFTFSEKDYLRFARRRAGEGTAPQGNQVPFELVLADGSVHTEPGTLVFVDRTVDPRTGTILAEAAFPNPALILRPGQYARVRAQTDLKPGAILVPQGAVQEVQGVYNVMVIGAGDKVEQRLVTTGIRQGALWVVESGLKSGERVVVEGLQKVRPGMQIAPTTVLIGEGEGAKPGAAEPAPEGEAEAAPADAK